MTQTQSVPAHLLWLEGIDFAEHLEDTTNLSVIRGASLALLEAAGAAMTFLNQRRGGYSLVFSGASLALFRGDVTADQAEQDGVALLDWLSRQRPTPPERDERKPARPPFGYLRFTIGTAADDGTAHGPSLAQARARLGQINGRLPRHPAPFGQQACAFSEQRVADPKLPLRLRGDHADSYRDRDTDAPDRRAKSLEAATVPVSLSAQARWRYGREQRQNFYTSRDALRERVPAGCSFTDNLQDMVDLWQPKDDTPGEHAETLRNTLKLSVLGKIAVFYADGNSFSDIRREMGGHPGALQRFSKKADDVVKAGVAAALGVVSAGAREPRSSPLWQASLFHDRGGWNEAKSDQLRFETLLYGGDEICIVAPAWFGLAMAEAFFQALDGAAVELPGGESRPLHFKGGLALVPVKMPIRSSFHLAKALADGAKRKERSTLAIHAFEGIEPPANGLSRLREQLFGAFPGQADALLALDAARFGEGLRALARTKYERLLPRSQLMNFLQAAQFPARDAMGFDKPVALNAPAANLRAKAAYDAYHDSAEHEGWLALLNNEDSAAMAAWLATHLWDYADPLAPLRAPAADMVAA